MDFNILVKSWELTSELGDVPNGVNSSEFIDIEASLNLSLPASLKSLYAITDGPSILQSNLNIVPLKSDDYSNLKQFTSQLKEWDFLIPNEVLAFADNGGDSTFGIWIEKNDLSDSPIIEIGTCFDSTCLSIVGTSLFNFLLGWTAYYFLLYEVNTDAIDLIKLPKELRFNAPELGDEEFAAIRKWADPKLPNFNPDPYVQKLDAQTIRELLKSSAT